MRILGIGEYCDLADMYHRLQARGHEVRVYIENPDAQDIFRGMLRQTASWEQELPWLREAACDGIVLFECAAKGELQDSLRRDGYQVIGGSGYGDRLEGDRQFGQSVLRELGLRTAGSRRFRSFSEARDFVRNSPRRYVFKNNGADTLRTQNYIGVVSDGSDMTALLSLYEQQLRGTGVPDFILMDHVEGIEVGVGAYFNGNSFLNPACLDWEHKRFFPGDLGELTGEMGTIVTYRGAKPIFDATLALMARNLSASGYQGYINLNLIVNEEGLWPLEFTSRFGYPGFAICETLHSEPWEAIFRKILDPESREVASSPGFAAGIVLCVPPFPYTHGYAEISKGAPISFRPSVTEADRNNLHFAEVALVGEQLVASGRNGYIGVATGAGGTVGEARQAAYEVARKVVVPNLRYRCDIGQRLEEGDLSRLQKLGLYDGP